MKSTISEVQQQMILQQVRRLQLEQAKPRGGIEPNLKYQWRIEGLERGPGENETVS